ncbi:MAG: sigma-70 family RNA polymerase sigma factor [Burkholderiaceae bacterium]|nr:sigma-70 family RNA polymerase sigma factor [Burkholderiaceae bacterium]
MHHHGRSGVERGAGESLIAEVAETRLIGLIAKEDLPAFETLYRMYFPRLTRFLGRMTRSASVIEEVINDTMLVVWQKAGSFDGRSKLSTWIFAIAYRKALKAMQAFDEPVESDFESYPDLNAPQPEGELEQRQLQVMLAGALAALPLEQRSVVCLAYYHGMDYQEIAAVMDCPVNTVKTRMFHARRRMKDMLGTRLEDRRGG